jgi:universal stress protein family protein
MADVVIFVRRGEELVSLAVAPYEAEAVLQELLEHYPQLLAGYEMSRSGAGRRGTLVRMLFSKVSRYCVAHARCPVLAIPPPPLARELAHSRLAWMFWHRPLTPERVLRDQPKPAA